MVIGCGDGSVRLFDRRLPPTEAKVLTWREHSSWVLGAYFKKSKSSYNLITSSTNGDVKFFDLRKNSTTHSIQATHGITTFVVHESADIFAW